MKSKLPAFTRRYLAGLDLHLKDDRSSGMKVARDLGMRAVKLGIETLQLARIHEEAMITLVLPHFSAHSSDGMIRRAGVFFAEAITPIEETHRGAREANVRLKGAIETLRQRSAELAALNKKLKREIVQRKGVENSLRISELTSSQLLEKSRHMQEELRLLSRRLLSVQEDERKKISRELHDVIAQTLTGINLQLSTLKLQSAASVKEFHKKISVTQRLVEKSVETVHRFARNLRPAVLDDLGLLPALHSYIKDFTKQTGIPVMFTAYPTVENLDNAARTGLYRVVQEALTNVARHSRASHAKVVIRKGRGIVCMDVHDNGRGFHVERIMFARNSKRLGLLGMRERVEMLGGAFWVESAPGKETTIHVNLPQHAGARGKPTKRKPADVPLKSP